MCIRDSQSSMHTSVMHLARRCRSASLWLFHPSWKTPFRLTGIVKTMVPDTNGIHNSAAECVSEDNCLLGTHLMAAVAKHTGPPVELRVRREFDSVSYTHLTLPTILRV